MPDTFFSTFIPAKVANMGGAVYICTKFAPEFFTQHEAAPPVDCWDFYLYTMKEKELGAYYIIIPAPIRNHPRLSVMAKFLYGEIAAKSVIYGYCWASNDFLCEVMQATERTVQRYLKELTDEGFIKCEYTRRSEKVERKIYLIVSYGNQNDKNDAAKNVVLPRSGGDKNDVLQNDKNDGYINNTSTKSIKNKKTKKKKIIPLPGKPAGGPQGEFLNGADKDAEPEAIPPGSAPPPLPKLLHQPFIEAYHDWFVNRMGGIKPKIAAKDAAAIKTLVASMIGAVKGAADAKKEIIADSDLPGKVLEGWKFLLASWHKLDAFTQKQIDLAQISSNFNTIIEQIRNGKGTVKPISGGANNGNSFARINEIINERYNVKG